MNTCSPSLVLPEHGTVSYLPGLRAGQLAAVAGSRKWLFFMRERILELGPVGEGYLTELVHQRPHTWKGDGYLRAFQAVKASLGRILGGKSAAAVLAKEHGRWYRQLFSASFEANMLAASDLAGYRNGPVYVKNATHVPPSAEAVRDMMPAFSELLNAEPNAGVRAVLGHFFFVFIHPYMDGNGRMARFIMNAMLASGGFPWTVISHEQRTAYFAALDAASARSDIGPFERFIAAAFAALTPPAI